MIQSCNMNMLIDAALVADSGAVYDLAKKLFIVKQPHDLALIPDRKPCGAKVVMFLNLVAISCMVVWAKTLGC